MENEKDRPSGPCLASIAVCRCVSAFASSRLMRRTFVSLTARACFTACVVRTTRLCPTERKPLVDATERFTRVAIAHDISQRAGVIAFLPMPSRCRSTPTNDARDFLHPRLTGPKRASADDARNTNETETRARAASTRAAIAGARTRNVFHGAKQ